MDERVPAMDPEAMGGGSHVGALRGLLAAGLDALKTRLDLATVEVELYLIKFVRMLLWTLAALAGAATCCLRSRPPAGRRTFWPRCAQPTSTASLP